MFGFRFEEESAVKYSLIISPVVYVQDRIKAEIREIQGGSDEHHERSDVDAPRELVIPQNIPHPLHAVIHCKHHKAQVQKLEHRITQTIDRTAEAMA